MTYTTKNLVTFITAACLCQVMALNVFAAYKAHWDKDERLAVLNEEKPDVVLVGNSMMYSNLSPKLMSELTGMKVVAIQTHGCMSAWKYLVLKNIIAAADHKPKIVVVVTRRNNATSPEYRNGKHRKSYMRAIESYRDPEEDLLDAIAYPEGSTDDGKFPSLTGEMINFNKMVDKSFVPHMLKIAKENNFHLVYAVHKTRELIDDPSCETPERKKYTRDFAGYVEKHGGTLFNYKNTSELQLKHYLQKPGDDHLNEPEGQRVWTTLMARDLEKLSSDLAARESAKTDAKALTQNKK